MSYLPTDASDFASKAIDGFVAAHPATFSASMAA